VDYGYTLWYRSIDKYDSFACQQFEILKSLTGLRTVHVNIVSVWDNPVSKQVYEDAGAIIEGLVEGLQSHIGNGVKILVHHNDSAESEERYD
jgi:hypothetical protein